MSAEDLQALPPQGVKALHDMLQGYNVTIVFLHRNRLALLKSVWLEVSKVRAKAEHVDIAQHFQTFTHRLLMVMMVLMLIERFWFWTLTWVGAEGLQVGHRVHLGGTLNGRA